MSCDLCWGVKLVNRRVKLKGWSVPSTGLSDCAKPAMDSPTRPWQSYATHYTRERLDKEFNLDT